MIIGNYINLAGNSIPEEVRNTLEEYGLRKLSV